MKHSTERVENQEEGVSTALGITVSTVPVEERAAQNAGSPSDPSDLKAEVVAPQKPPMSEINAATSALASPGPELPAPSDNAALEELDSPGVAPRSPTVESNTGLGVFLGRKRPRSPNSSEPDNPSPVKRPSSDIATTIWALFGKNRDGYINERGFSEEVRGEEQNLSDDGVMGVADARE